MNELPETSRTAEPPDRLPPEVPGSAGSIAPPPLRGRGRRRSAIKYINLSIAVLIAALLGVIYWFAYRPLPKVSGEITAPISQGAQIVRDRLGVPHIRAANWEDAIFLQGYATAQDRLWQMDALRRLAAGELSEIVGPVALETDRDAHRLRLRRMAESAYATLQPADRAVLAAYARGVNYFISTHLHDLPLEFTLLNYDPRPWSIIDSILAGLQMYRNLTTTWPDEIEKKNMLAGGDVAKVNELFPSRIGHEIQPGSNAWAVSGALTASGKPILANDPHLEYSIPATWYQVHVQAPGLNVIGVSLPGVPCVIIGHNDRIAWGVTNLGYDVQDLYRERMDRGTGRYLFEGKPEQARLERDWIAVKNAKPVEFTQWVTRHGPVMFEEGGQLYALRWAAAEPGSFQFPFLDLNRAKNWGEFTSALARFPGPGQNFVYADVDGNIGYHATGRLPVRRGYDGDVPSDGASGQNEWQGFLNFDSLPSFFDPSGNMIVTANQNPFPKDFSTPVHGEFASPYRSQQIHDLLSAHKGWRPEDMLAVQKDVYSAFSRYLAERMVAAYDRRKPNDESIRDAVSVLRNWNGQMEKDAAAPMVASLAYLELRKRLASIASPGKGAIYTFQMAPAVVEQIVRRNGSGWTQDMDGLLLSSLKDGIAAGSGIQGSSIARWKYGYYNELHITQPVGNQLPFVARYFNIGPVPMSGSGTTVKQTTKRLGPSMRFIADLSNWDHSLNNITVGESGQILSTHYGDQWEPYYYGRSFPMQFGKVESKATLSVKPGG